MLIKNKGLDVNYLKMSATPIPRSLAISAYGDTDISIIQTMPKIEKKLSQDILIMIIKRSYKSYERRTSTRASNLCGYSFN